MANEIQANVSLTCTNGNFKFSFSPGAINVTQSAQGFHGPIVSVSTAEENLSFGDLSTYGMICGRNLDSANYVIAGPTTTSTGPMIPFMRVKAGEPFLFRMEPGKLWRWKAVGGTVKVQVNAFEN